MQWELRNADGTLARRGEQPNLIVDRGMDQLLTNTSHGSTTTGQSTGSQYYLWRSYFCVGTGSTAPAFTQTNLVAEVMRGQSSGGFSAAEELAVYSIAGGLMTMTHPIVRVLDFTASYNLTEFGFSEVSTAGGNVVIRELFRDGAGTPVTLSVQSGQQLKMTHQFIMTLTWAAGVSQTVTVTGIGAPNGLGSDVLTGDQTWFSINANNRNFFAAVTLNAAAGQSYIRYMSTANTGDPNSLGGTVPTGSADSLVGTAQPYTSGTFRRVRRFVILTSAHNAEVYGWVIQDGSGTGATNSGWKFSLRAPVKVTKTSQYKLTLDFELAFARAS